MPESAGQTSTTSLRMAYASGAAFLQMQKLARIAQDAMIRRYLRTEPKLRTPAEIKYLQQWVDSRLAIQTKTSGVRSDVLPRAMRYMSLRRGEPLFAQHEHDQRFYIVIRGSLSNYEVLDEVTTTEEDLTAVEESQPVDDPDDAEEHDRAQTLTEKLDQERRLRRDAILAQLVPHHGKELMAKEYQPPEVC